MCMVVMCKGQKMNKDSIEHYGCLIFLLLIFILVFSCDKINTKASQEFSQTIYYDNGNIRMKISGKDGLAVIEDYYDNGMLSYVHTIKANSIYDCIKKKQISHGPYKSYHENGILAKEGFIENGHKEGVEKQYYKNGNLEYQVIRKNDKLEGEAKWYYIDGRLGFVGKYEKDESIGKHKTYYPNQKLAIENSGRDEMWKTYFNGVLLGVPTDLTNIKCYDEQGGVINCKKGISSFIQLFMAYQRIVYNL